MSAGRRNWFLSAKPIDADLAYEWGLVNKVCEPDKLIDDTLEIARAIGANAPLSVMRAKQSLSIATQLDRGNAMQFELEAYNRLVGTEDRLEGVRAFNEKRKPNWKSR